ncbi:MAG: hypothetical protein M3R12_05725 [Actinomycetota bacterium]|nr:hypothetical protein [Actinomycetota bacterium]
MTNGMFVLALAVGAGLLATWIHTRFPGLTPERLGTALLHTGAAMVVLRVVPIVMESELSPYVTLFAIALPGFVYAMLTAIWLMRQAQTALGLQR